MEHDATFLPLYFTYQNPSSRQLGSITGNYRQTHCRAHFSSAVFTNFYKRSRHMLHTWRYAKWNETVRERTREWNTRTSQGFFRPSCTSKFIASSFRCANSSRICSWRGEQQNRERVVRNTVSADAYTSTFCYLERVLYSRKRAAGANIHSCLRCSGRHPVALQARLLMEVARDLCSYYFHRNAPAPSSKHEHTS